MISLAMIVSNKDAKQAENTIKSVEKYVDEVCITIADKEHKTKDILGYKTSFFKWEDDFSKARTFNFKQCKGNWILWLDSDDILTGGENLKELVILAEEKNVSAFGFLYKYGFDKNGNCIDEHWKTQLLKNDGHFEWKGAIHEDPMQKTAVNWVKTEDCIRVHTTSEERTVESFERNLRILEAQATKEEGKEPRTLFYLGRTYVASNQWQKAIDVLQEYLTLSGWDEERYEANLLIGQCFLNNNQISDAITWYNNAILEKEVYPDAFIYKGMAFLKQEKFKEAISNFETAVIKKRPDANTYYNPMLYSKQLTGAMAVAYMHVGEFDKAVKYATYSYDADSNDENSIEILKLTRHIKDKIETAKLYKKLSDKLEERGQKEKIPTLLSSVPLDLLDNPYIVGLRGKFMKPRKWKEKTMAVFCGDSAEVWTPESVNGSGVGGSETAVIEITKRLAKKGWKITVYNKSNVNPEGEIFDGVTYKNYWDFNFQDEFNVLWVWRLPEVFDYPITAKYSLLDLHDVMNPLDFTDERLSKIDKIFVKTKYHRGLMPDIPDDKFEIIGNGIDVENFDKEVEKEPYRFIYSSTPNRGLDIILDKIWDKIREAIPDAELHVYYGWNTFYEIEKNNPERMAWMEKMKMLMDKPGVINHGRVGQKELHNDMLKSSYWLYPTYFPEIHCITACEMQMAGVIPITSGYAALEETQIGGIKLDGDVYDPKWQDEFVDKVIKQIKKDDWKEREVLKLEARQFSWGIVAREWEDKICE